MGSLRSQRARRPGLTTDNQLMLMEAAASPIAMTSAGRAPKKVRRRWQPGALSEAMLSVGEFHRAFDLARAARPCADVPSDLAKLRVDLLVEEVREFTDATHDADIVALADALGDIVYVAYGAAITYGIDLDAVLREVHRSNMSKLDAAGRPIYRADGKVLKSDRYFQPNLPRVLFEQQSLPF